MAENDNFDRGKRRAEPLIAAAQESWRIKGPPRQILIYLLENCYEADAGPPDDETGACPQGLFCRDSIWKICKGTGLDVVPALVAIAGLSVDEILRPGFLAGPGADEISAGEVVDARLCFRIFEGAIK